MASLRTVQLTDAPTLKLIEAQQAAEGEPSATATVRRLIRDGLTFRRLRDAGQIINATTSSPSIARG